ncbi:ATP-binding cassette, subfamily G protein [Acrasis kona]|uniref:ATP-binding cassette, subfamily G protein n=1 Tax=Acrasis kona TaxID=1008807 RepID=A0AAW2ZKI8_9EUKA
MNGGICQPNGVCGCIEGFMNDLDAGINNCSLIYCANNGTMVNGVCQCSPGWGGSNCLLCGSDQACKSKLGRENVTCDNSYQLGKQKSFNCSMNEEWWPIIGNYTQILCTDVYPLNGSKVPQGFCELQMFDDPGLFETAYCKLSHCHVRWGSANDVTYKCTNTSCTCSHINPKCDDPLVSSILAGMLTDGQVTCDISTKRCVLTQTELPGTIFMECLGAECIDSPLPPIVPDKPPLFYFYLFIGLASATALLMFITLLTCTVLSIHQSYIIKKEELLYRDENKGASLDILDLTYTMNNTKILNDINYSIRPGSVVAIMGPSGAGKTTLIDIMANRVKSGTVAGQLLLNGRKYGSDFSRLSGYVFQDDLLMSTMTVRECITFSANLRLPYTMSSNEKNARVNQAMQELGISHIADRKIGNELKRGISGGERRRVSIATELVISPHILFLDEPTSGLDSASAFSVMKTITNLSKNGRTIVFSIHQPRSNIFATFHDLLLLHRGQVVYAGPACEAEDYFVRMGYPSPAHTNTADYLIDLLTDELYVTRAESNYVTNDQESISLLGNQDQASYQNATHPVPFVHVSNQPAAPTFKNDVVRHPYGTSDFHQLLHLSGRSFKNFIRNFYLLPAHLITSVVLGLVLGICYRGMKNDIEGCHSRLGSLFAICAILCFSCMSSLDLFITERAIFLRERKNGYYRTIPYFFSKIIFDLLLLRVIPPMIIGSICYFLMGLRSDDMTNFSYFGWFLLIMVLFNLTSGALCIAIGCIAPSLSAGNTIATIVILSNAVFSGFLLNKPTVPYFMRWLFYGSFWHYAVEALASSQFAGFPIILDSAGRSITDTGEFYLNKLGLDKHFFYNDLIALVGYTIGLLVLSCIFLVAFVKERR